MPDLRQSLRDLFDFSDFRPLQEEAVRAAIEGRDALVVMPTGAGKSLCFQLPAALAEGGVTLVVSPLIALMRDQVNALLRRPAFAELGCACLSSLQGSDEQRAVLLRLRAGKLRLLYVAPERFRSPAFLDALRAASVARLVVDEAHCISEWGHDFRPDYLTLRDVAAQLGEPPVTAVTATATRRVQQSIIANLGLRDPLVLAGGFNRANLHFSVYRCRTERERGERLTRALPKLASSGGSGLVYVATRKQCEHLAEVANAALTPIGLCAGLYHAGLDGAVREEMQARWLAGDIHTLVATNAFGMGIDKPDVRFVVHCGCPDSLESYYQEAGRAGRDGRKSRCVVLYHFTDRRTREWFIDNDALTPSAVADLHREIAAQASDDGAFMLSKTAGARLVGGSPLTLRLALGELERAGLIQRLGETDGDIPLRVQPQPLGADALRRIGADLRAQREERLRRLDDITDYCKTTDCRRRTILDYFGDRLEPPPSPFCCDNCERPAPAQESTRPARTFGPSVPMPTCITPGDIHALLQGLDALRPALGRARLNKLLRGSSAKDVDRFSLARCPLYGALKGISRDAVDAFLSQLLDDGLLRQGDEDDYFVCTVTEAGREAWQMQTPLTLTVPGSPRRRPVPQNGTGGALAAEATDADNDVLFDRLRAWRTGEASALGLPPYCVFSDKTLREIARQQPQTEDALRAVSGVGPAKLEKYGDAVLALAREAD